ncbi:MAG: amidohydrolase [Acidobacteria bacterium]|nr:MAG: amidohydrolase [Acidobacteriota bacterium]
MEASGLDRVRRLRERVLAELERIEPRMRDLAADLHRRPELGLREEHAAGRLAAELEEDGFEATVGIGGLRTAFKARRGHGRPAVAFLAEYDALPGLGHAGGHNLVSAVAYAAASALGSVVSETGGTILVVGAPAEETIGGKVVLDARGELDGIDAALLAHPAGEDLVRVDSLASWSMEVLFEGRASHAVVAPERGIDALDAMIRLFVARDALREELGPEVRMPGVILEGGVRPNVVPDRARARFSLRAATARELVDRVVPAFEAMVAKIARETGARARVKPVDNLYHEFTCSEALARRYERHASELGLAVRPGPGRPFGSLDVGRLSQRVPVLHPLFRIGPPDLASHTETFASAAASGTALDAAARVCRALALTALDLLADPAAVAEAQAERKGSGAVREAPLIVEAGAP